MTPFMPVNILLFVLSGVLDIAGAAALARLLEKPGLSARPSWVRQLAAGLIMGILAVCGTEMGIGISGASVNLRDAAPLIAGLLFGGPSGILAGVIGGVERFLAAGWGAGEYTKLACSLSTVTAGFFAAALRRWFFLNKRPRWPYALLIGAAAEVIHMLLIFLTNAGDIETAFLYVRRCAPFMIAGTALCTAGAVLAVQRLTGKPREAAGRDLETILQKRLAAGLTVAFFVTVFLTWTVFSHLSFEDTASLLRVQLEDVPQEINDILEDTLTDRTLQTAAGLTQADARSVLDRLTQKDVAAEVYITDHDGVVVLSADPAVSGTDLSTAEGALPYLSADAGGTAGARTESFLRPGRYVRYSAAELPKAGFRLIIGYTDGYVAEELRRLIALGALHRHAGASGYLILADSGGNIVSSENDTAATLEELGFIPEGPPMTLLTGDVQGERTAYMYADLNTVAGPYTGIALIPAEEAGRSAVIALYMTVFIEILIFFDLFIHLAVLVRRRVVNELREINTVLGRIAAGDLDEAVEVNSSSEFAELSADINTTVDALKDLIAKEAARVDAELEAARVIQRTSLPSVFPPYPSHTEFCIYAFMEAAKEVGGDFYDFYLLGEERLVFLIADVSGKGIPAALFMMRAKTQLKGLTESGLAPGEVFRRANNALCENNAASMFVTVWMGILDLNTGEVTYVNAGHNPGLLLRSDGTCTYLRTDAGFVLGGLEDYPYTAGTFFLAPGDMLALYTDGVTEAENVLLEQFGEEALMKTAEDYGANGPEALCLAVRAAVRAFAGGAEPSDDLTVLALQYLGRSDADMH